MKKVNKRSIVLSFIVISCLCLLMFLRINPVIVMSGSMEPLIKTGSLCLVWAKAPFEEIKVDDVITYNVLEGKVTHRVVDKYNGGLITKGDANRVKDLGVVTKSNYFGKVILNVPYVGFLLYYLKKYSVFVFFLLLSALFMGRSKNHGGDRL